MNLLQRIHHPHEALPEEEGEELVDLGPANDESNLICPITRSEMVHPMKKKASFFFPFFLI